MCAVRRVTDTRDRGPELGEGMSGHTTGYVEAGRVPGKPRLRGVAVELSVRRGVRLPSLLALIGKAFGQMQLAAAGLDPTLERFTVAGHFCPAPARRPGARPRPATGGCSGRGTSA